MFTNYIIELLLCIQCHVFKVFLERKAHMLNEYGPGKIESRACKYSTLFLLCSYCINASIKLKIYSKRLTIVNAKWHDTIIVIFFHFLNGL